MTSRHPGDPLEAPLKSNFLDFQQSKAPRASSPLLQRIDKIQHVIKATLGGTAKEWLNVQPCVFQGFNSLMELVQNHEKRLSKIDDGLNEMRQTVQLLINDRILKEERYQLDHAMQSETVTSLEKLTERLHLMLEGERKSRHRLQREVQWLQRDIQNLEKKCYRQFSGASRILTEAQAAGSVKGQQGYNSQKLHEDLMREIHLLRVQWENYRREQQEATLERSNKQAALQRPPNNCRYMSPGKYEKLSFPPQSARWFWMGDGNSHFSTALARSSDVSGYSISSPIPWEKVQLYDPATMCWYTAQFCVRQTTEAVPQDGLRQMCSPHSTLRSPYADTTPNTARPISFYRSPCDTKGEKGERVVGKTYAGTERLEQWNCFDWVRPRSIRIARAGIYKYTTCLVRDTHSSSHFSGGVGTAGEGLDSEVLVLYVNHRCVASLGVSNSFVLLRANPPSSTKVRRVTPPGRRRARSLSAPRRSSPEVFVRPCCEPDQLVTSTLSDYVFLPEGAIVQVRCHNMHNTKAIYEAFLELEYIM